MNTSSDKHADDLAIPAFLDRKLNPQTPATMEERRAYAQASLAAATHAKAQTVRALAPEEDEGPQLTHGEEEELAEIKAMVKTSLEHAKRMAHDWVTRIGIDRKAAARRRAALKTVKGLRRRT